MEKTKLGIPVTVMAALVCLLGYYGGYVIAGVAVGYVLLVEQNAWLKKSALKVLSLLLCFSVASTVIYLIPNIVSMIESLAFIFTEEYFEGSYYRVFEFFSSLLNLLKTVLFVLMGCFWLAGKDLKIPVLDKLLDKLLQNQAQEV